MKNLIVFAIIIVGLISGVSGSFITYAIIKDDVKTAEVEDIKSNSDWAQIYYESAAATLQSPHGLRLKIDEGKDDFVLVDVRKNEFYELGHIVGAIHLPVDRTPDEVLEDFQKLREENKGKDIIIYCYSTSCLNGRKVGRFLSQNDVFVKELSIGYNEWVLSHEIWNYPQEEYNIQDYIVTGNEPGEFEPISPAKNVNCGSEAFAC